MVATRHPEHKLKIDRSPMKMSATQPAYEMPPPLLEQPTEEMLRRVLGVGDAEIAALRKKKVV